MRHMQEPIATQEKISLPKHDDRADFDTCIAELERLGYELAAHSARIDIRNMRLFCDGLRSPQTKFPCVLVAGTNGKGSTCAMKEARRRGGRSVVLIAGSIYLLGGLMRELSLDV